MKILCIPYTHTLFHISRPLLVAKELRNRGHEIVFAGESPKIKFIQQEGFDVVPIYEPDPDRLFGNIRKGKLKFVDDAELERMIEADSRSIDMRNLTSCSQMAGSQQRRSRPISQDLDMQQL
jgi:UDP:flavonoid glycosyltransferase YjiC (YdhE family)